MKRSKLKEIIKEEITKLIEFGWEYDIENFEPKINKEKKTITFVNDAEVRQATAKLKKRKVQFSRPALQPKTLKFVNTHEFKKAQKILK